MSARKRPRYETPPEEETLASPNVYVSGSIKVLDVQVAGLLDALKAETRAKKAAQAKVRDYKKLLDALRESDSKNDSLRFMLSESAQFREKETKRADEAERKLHQLKAQRGLSVELITDPITGKRRWAVKGGNSDDERDESVRSWESDG